MDGNKTAKFQMSETLKASLRILLLLASAGMPYYFRFVLGMEVTLTDFLYAAVILVVLWWPTGGTLGALFLSLLLIISHLFVEPTTPLLHDLQRSLTLFAIALVMSALSRQAKEAEQEIRQRSQELSALNAIASTASQSLDLDEILGVTFDKVLETMGAEAGGIYLLDEGERKLGAKVYRGFSPEFVEETMRWDESLARRVLRSGEPMVVEDISKEPGLTRMAAKGEGLRSYISVPLKSKDKALGVMDVILRSPRRFAPRDVELLTSIGNQIGVPIANARLYEAAQREITARKQAEEQLVYMATHDTLTGVPNRRGFFTLAEQQLKMADRTRRRMALLFADFDHLKRINDALGHPEGDRALIEVADVLKETFRESDIIARIGGDEFVVLAIETDMTSPEVLTTRLQENLEARNARGGRRYKLSLSVGVACYDPEHPCSIDELLARADRAMYEQKEGDQKS